MPYKIYTPPTHTRFHYILWGNKRCTLHGLANVMVMSDSQLTKVFLVLRETLRQEYITETNNYSDIPKHGWVDAFLTYTTLRTNSADDKLIIFFFFFSQLPFHANCHQWRQSAYDTKACFMGEKRYFKMSSAEKLTLSAKR